jgi:ATP-binding cassette subfamily B protein
MTQISPSVTIMALIPLVIVGIVANIATRSHRTLSPHIASSRRQSDWLHRRIFRRSASRQSCHCRKECHHRYFHKINDERRKLTIREKLFDEVLGSIYRNTSTLGTGVILVLVGQSMRTGNFTLGDFSLFVYLLQSMGDLTTFGGMLWARYKQLNVSVKRMYHLMENAPLDALVEHSKN